PPDRVTARVVGEVEDRAQARPVGPDTGLRHEVVAQAELRDRSSTRRARTGEVDHQARGPGEEQVLDAVGLTRECDGHATPAPERLDAHVSRLEPLRRPRPRPPPTLRPLP